MSVVISISNHKGGVGKTTSSVNIGAGLSRMGKKVLLIDLDPQANLSQSLGVKAPNFSVYGALRGKYGIEEAVHQLSDTLFIVPSELDLSGAELELALEAGREFILKELVNVVKEAFDVILIDCPPSLGLLTINAFTASQHIYLPLQAEFLALQGVSKLVEVIEKVQKRLNQDLAIRGVLITQYDHRKILNRNVLETIKKHFGDKVFNTVIRDNIALAEAPTSGKDIFQYNPKSNGAIDYQNLCEEIMMRLN